MISAGVALCCLAVLPVQRPDSERGPAALVEEGFRDLCAEGFSAWRGRPHLAPGSEGTWTPEERERRQRAWDEALREHWTWEDGVFVSDGAGPYLTTRDAFGDVDLRLEWRMEPGADGGIYLRATPQVQLWDPADPTQRDAGNAWGSGGLWNDRVHPRFPLENRDRPAGEWNEMRIVQVGERVAVWLNGGLVVAWAPLENYWDRSRPLPPSGPIQFQTHGGRIEFRRVRVRELSADEANAVLRAIPPETAFGRGRPAAGGDTFHPLLVGRDGEGWAGPLAGWEFPEDGMVRCRAGQGGTIYAEKVLRDFQVRLEFLLPPGGNNGLAIRYPGEGDTAYVGMCELQVLDDSHERYAGLHPYQYHGSAYGMVPSLRGYQRPVGEWNFQEVTVQGGRVRVELNGTVILDADLWEIEETADGKEHPGRMRTEGFFGFAGHGDPVAFRNVEVREL